MSTARRNIRSLPAAAGALLLLTAAGQSWPSSVPIPDDFGPEGVAMGTGSTFYVGSLPTGDIYSGDLRDGSGGILVDAPPGRLAAGLRVDEPRHRLFVVGGPTGEVYVYNSRTGADLRTIPVTDPGTALLNDVTLTPDAAWVTDSFNPVLYKIPIAPNGELGDAETLALTGPAAAVLAFPNLNGIAATPDGSTLIVGHGQLGALFTVDPDTGHSDPIVLTGGALTPGTVDGLLLEGSRHLWVVENFANRVVGIRLSPDLSSGRVTAVITDADVGGLFRIPTTVAEHG
ncbi:MAG: SMP-30/gluconolactonase/LRE family protein, partial [Nocardioidaceae bacterium]